MKTCSHCKISKVESSFRPYTNKKNGKKYLRSWCNRCIQKADAPNAAKRRATNRERFRASDRKHNLARYGLTPDSYAAMLVSQGGVCAICGNPPAFGENLFIDHCHNSDEVRGLLCNKCNMGLGCFGDNPHNLANAKNYLERFYGNQA